MVKLTLAITVCLVILASGLSAEQKTLPRKGWKLTWRDEFNGRKIDPRKWNVLIREHSKHNELRYYVPDDVYIEDGCLRLRSRVRDLAPCTTPAAGWTPRASWPRLRAVRNSRPVPAERYLAGTLALSAEPRLANGICDGGSRGEWERADDSRGTPVVQ